MTLVSKDVILSRHGAKIVSPDKVLKEQISPESLARLYANGETNFGKFKNVDRLALFISQRPRTEASGKARLAGALGLKPVPQSQSEILTLGNYPRLDRLDVNRRYGLGFYPGDLNEEVYREGEKQRPTLGGQRCVEFGLQNLDSVDHEGKVVRPFGHMVGKVGKVILEAINLAKSDGKSLVELASHAVNADAGAALLVSSARGEQMSHLVKTSEEYGGPFAEEGFGILNFVYDAKSGLFTEARFIRDGENFPVDMTNLTNLATRFNVNYSSS